jgi:hypothetical protein
VARIVPVGVTPDPDVMRVLHADALAKACDGVPRRLRGLSVWRHTW